MYECFCFCNKARNIRQYSAKNWKTLLILLLLCFAFFKLPSDPFKYLSWHDIEEHDVQGNQLHCPRVREGKEQKDTHGLKPHLYSIGVPLNVRDDKVGFTTLLKRGRISAHIVHLRCF